MSKSLRAGIVSLALMTLFGCGQAPEIPQLNRLGQAEPTPIALSNELSPGDIKKIFKSVNRDGKLKSLERYFLEPSDGELTEIADLITKYVYQDSQLPTGLVAIVRNRFQRKDFSDLKKRAESWVKDSKYSVKANTILDAAKSELLPELITSDIGMVLPTFTVPLDQIWKQTNQQYQEKYSWPTRPSPSPEDLFVTIKKLVQDKEVVDRLSSQAGVWRENGFLVNLLRGFYFDYQNHKIEAFEGLAHKLPELLPNQKRDTNVLETLMTLVQFIDGPSDGLFSLIQTGLDEMPDQFTLLVEYLRFLDADAVQHYFKKSLLDSEKNAPLRKKSFWEKVAKRGADGKPSAEFIVLFKKSIEAFERILGPVKTGTDLDFFVANLPNYLNAYVFTRWCEGTLAGALELPEWKSAKEDDFLPVLFKMIPPANAFQINLKKDPAKSELLLLLTELSPAFGKALAKLLNEPGLGAFNYQLTEYEGSKFAEGTKLALRAINEIRPIANSPNLLRTLLALASGKDTKSFQLADLETTNLLTSLSGIIQSIPFPLWIKLEHILFEQLRIGELSEDIRKPILAFYASKPNLQTKVAGILDNVQSFHELHVAVRDLPSPITLYHSILRQVPPEQLDNLGKIIRLVADTKIVSLDPETKQPLYPGIYRILERGTGLGEFLMGIALVGKNPMLEIAGQVLHGIITDSNGIGIRRHAEFAQKLCASRAQGVTAWISEFMAHSKDWVESAATIPANEEEWARRVVLAKDHGTLWRFFMKYGSVEQTLQMARELLVLDRKGTLTEAFDLLGRLRNERLQVISTFLLAWQKSGEMTQFLQAVELLLAPIADGERSPRRGGVRRAGI